jgi:hypothetical protein
MGEHLMGRGHSGAQCASGDQKRGYGEKWGEHTHNHTLLRPGSSEKDAQGPPQWHSAGRPDQWNTAGRTQTLGRGHPMPTPILRATADARQSTGVLGGGDVPLLPARGGRAREGRARPS